MGFRHRTGAVSGQQIHQIIHMHLKLASLICMHHMHALGQRLKDDGIILNIVVAVDGIPLSREGLVGNQAVITRVEQQRIASDTAMMISRMIPSSLRR